MEWGSRFQRMGESIFSASETGGILDTPFVGIYYKYFQKIYAARRTVIVKFCVGHWSEYSMQIVVSNTSKLHAFGRFQIQGSRVVKICMIF